jgi:streptogramin lyase
MVPSGTCVSRFDPLTDTAESLEVDDGITYSLRGIAVGVGASEGYVWASDTSGQLVKLHADDMEVVNTYTVGTAAMVGVAVDFEGFVWTVSMGGDACHKFDPDLETFVTVPIGDAPYTYSDMTGVQLKNAVYVE